MVVVPMANDKTRIPFAMQVLQALESRSNLRVDDPLEMKTRGD